ncbi:MAG: dimethylmenaquinone methyltransferase [Rhodospirillaceae bacterium]|nr:dimethylmenaquinone methyltransferase [Rhodospirillaceae bacterium]
MTDNIVDRLRQIDTCAVSDALDALGLKGTVIGIKPISVLRRVSGRVQTVKLDHASENVPKVHLCSAAVDAAESGDVIVVENHAREDAAGWGGILSTAAAHKGLSATIVDGPVRDADESRDVDYPVFARSAIPFTARGRIAEHAWNIPVDIGGVTVNPGDLVLADGSGVVFVDQNREEDIVAKAEEIAAKEAAMAAAVRKGKKVSDVMGGDYENMLLQKDQ